MSESFLGMRRCACPQYASGSSTCIVAVLVLGITIVQGLTNRKRILDPEVYMFYLVYGFTLALPLSILCYVVGWIVVLISRMRIDVKPDQIDNFIP